MKIKSRASSALVLLLGLSLTPTRGADDPTRVSPSVAEPSEGGIVSVQTDKGMLYLGGNRMSAPYELSYVGDRFAVNGFALPPAKPPRTTRHKYSAEEQAQIAFTQRMGDVGDSLRATGMSPKQQGEVIRSMCANSPLFDSVTVAPRCVTLWFHGGGRRFPSRVQVELAQKWVPVKPVSRREMRVGELEQIRKLLEMGSAVFILDGGNRIIVPPEKADALVSQARAGTRLDDHTLARQLRSPVPLVRVK